MLPDFLADVTAATARYGLRDDLGRTMDTLKVIANPDGGYLGVYHVLRPGGAFAVELATSSDLLAWTRRATLDVPASQPTIAELPGGGFVVALEAGGSGGPAWLRFLRYPSTDRLLGARPDRTVDAPHTMVPPGRLAEGTPNVYAAGESTIDVGFHYQRHGRVDRQARGRLTGFRRWTARRDKVLDAAVSRWDVSGNIGGRDAFTWDGRPYVLIEGQHRRGDWGSWRVFLHDVTSGEAQPLNVRTPGGSTAFANPSVTALTGPDGRPVLVVTMFLFEAAPGEGGPLLYYRPVPLGQRPTP